MLTVTSNKAQSIDLIVEDIVSHKIDFQTHKLVVTGSDPVPLEIEGGQMNKRPDMTTTQEEGDTLIIQQVSRVLTGTVLVVADDTDIFVLLLHFCHLGKITSHVLMVSPIHGRTVLDVNAAVEEHKSIIPDLLAAHGLTGCDTVASYFGIGKAVALKALRTGKYKLDLVGNMESEVTDVIDQSTKFMLACYGQPNCQSLTEARQKAWSSKIGRSKATAPKLCSLPPTTEAFKANVARAHLQVGVWRRSLEACPAAIDPTAHGWSRDVASGALVPTIVVPVNTPLVPPELLTLIKCTCHSQNPCSTQRCSCKKASMACTQFCSCQGGGTCQNDHQDVVDDADD